MPAKRSATSPSPARQWWWPSTAQTGAGSEKPAGRSCEADADGIEDHIDACPQEAELFNNYKDEDGCPEKDSDDDGVFDDADQCLTEREDPDNWQDEDGCPDTDNDND